MPHTIIYSSRFINKAKALKKKHLSLVSDLKEFEKELLLNPKQGDNLGGGLYKVRLAVKSKGKGKSGGYRVITYLITESDQSITVNMLTLYDKSEESSINKSVLIKFINELFL